MARDHVSHTPRWFGQGRQVPWPCACNNTHANLGAYLSTFASAVPTIHYATLLAGQYSTPQVYVEVDSWFTNTAPVDLPGRRPGLRPPTCWSVWSPLRVGMGLSRRNPPSQFHPDLSVPDAGGAASTTLGDFHACMDGAKSWPMWRALSSAKAASAAKGLRGIGYSSYIEACWHLPHPTSQVPWAHAPGCLNAARCGCTPRAA